MENNNNVLGGINASTLAEEFGTPLYVYNADKMTEQYNAMMTAFDNTNVRLNYACKALTNINVLKHFKALGAGLDAVSIQEVWMGLKAGFEPQHILFTPNGVSFEEIEMAINEGVQINIDNLSILEQFGIKYGNSYPVCIRLNPHIMAGGNAKISVGHIDSKFGISIYQLPHIQRIVETNNLHINGLHMHTGSDILDVDAFLRGTDILLGAAKQFKGLDFIDFGSGFKVKYKASDIGTNIEELGEKLSATFNNFCAEYAKELQLIFEPGKFLVSESGEFLTKVNVVKQTTSAVFVGVDSGFNHFPRPMMYDAYHNITNHSNPGGRERIYTVVGYICETDTFGWNRRLNEVNEGDILGFKNAGAYCMSMASNYNSRFRPAEVLIKNGETHLIRKRENFDDLLQNQIEI